MVLNYGLGILVTAQVTLTLILIGVKVIRSSPQQLNTNQERNNTMSNQDKMFWVVGVIAVIAISFAVAG